MATNTSEGAQRTERDHDRILHLFASMWATLREGDWRRCADAYQRFVLAFDDHMRHEEDLWFSRYAASSDAAAEEVELFLEQHAYLRQLLGKINIHIHERIGDPDVLEAFEEAWVTHDATEARHFEPWLSEQ